MKLKEEHKEFVVKGYACFMKPGEILENFIRTYAKLENLLIHPQFFIIAGEVRDPRLCVHRSTVTAFFCRTEETPQQKHADSQRLLTGHPWLTKFS